MSFMKYDSHDDKSRRIYGRACLGYNPWQRTISEAGEMGCIQSGKKVEKEGDGEKKDSAGGEKIIVVFGATGAQGGSVARALIADGGFKVRAVTRNPDSEKAKDLENLGADVVKADLDDVASIKTALEGAYGVFFVTQYWESCDKDKELQQGKNAVDVAKEMEIKHVVYSGLENVQDLTGKECQCFDAKGQTETYLKESGVPYTIVRVAFYYQNLLTLLKPAKQDDGTYLLLIPMGDVPMYMVSVADIGVCVAAVFKNLSEYQGQTFGLAGTCIKMTEYAEILSKHLEPIKFCANEMTPEDFCKQEITGASVLGTMFRFLQDGPVNRDVEMTRYLNPDMQSFDQWVESQKVALQAVISE